MEAKKILEEIKNSNVRYAIVNENNEVYCNLGTHNIMDIYGLDDDNGHFYGVYGDAVGGQIDSRNLSDKAIEKSIEIMLSLGKPVKRSDLVFEEDFKRAFVDRFDAQRLASDFGLSDELKVTDEAERAAIAAAMDEEVERLVMLAMSDDFDTF
ncbi:hypothetical protein BU202_08305 [Streptococcus cuniculi]|uniref:Uncharacterized protein n=1 Tax=Streptococcus cuniculi TaxID=1432788 RepID=A0A1Q8E6D0_9STRE|nr:hypothetical protein [Streptococcus cuniculi]OLF47319.1 hypothetical protein BU202_08305 [Streptococcus cuniculi]QBX23173.1 hypothetical protein Javan116_0044 [Streptococcus phage Javan116]